MVVAEVFIVTDDSELVKVSFVELVVLHVPKSITKEPAPTVEPELLYSSVTKVWYWLKMTTKDESLFLFQCYL